MFEARNILLLASLLLLAAGCSEPEDPPIWENVKIGDLAPADGTEPGRTAVQQRISFDVHIFEVPADNVDKLGAVWQALYIRPVRFLSTRAFQANHFAVAYGDSRTQGAVNDALAAAGGTRLTRVALILTPGETQDVAVTPLRRQQTVTYVSTRNAHDEAVIGPGVLNLRIKAVRTPGTRDQCSMAAEPAFTVPMHHAIPQFTERARSKEVQFAAAGFAVRMAPGDIVVLGPSIYISDDTTLQGLFFTNPEGGPFPNPDAAGLPQRKAAVRVFTIICTSVR